MARHTPVLTHLSWRAKRFVYATGVEALWLAGSAFLALFVWRWLLPLCVPVAGGSPPIVLWWDAHVGLLFLPLVVQYAGWVPQVGAGLIVGVVALLVLWEPADKKLHRWALVYLRTWWRCPRVATHQPRPR